MPQKTTHTPGPWAVGEYDSASCRIWVYVEPKGDNSDSGCIAEVAYADGSNASDQGEANAQLIATAPDLLSNLIAMATKTARVIENWETGDLAQAVRELDYARRAACKIIDKARGES